MTNIQSTSQSTLNLIANIAHTLNQTYNDAQLATQHAWWLLESITDSTKAALIGQEHTTLSYSQKTQIDEWLDALINKKMPIAYLIGSVPFLDLTITVKPPLLIPRPETEAWCAWLIEMLKKITIPLTIIEPCTGTGCIALALAQALPHATVIATDISPLAIEVALHNAERNSICNVHFYTADLLSVHDPSVRADLIVSNPPYIAESEWHSLDPSVAQWEDKRALVAPDNGLGIIKKLVAQAPYLIRSCQPLVDHHIPNLLIEIGYTQAEGVVAIMKRAHYTAVQVQVDIAGNDRVVGGRVPDVEATMP